MGTASALPLLPVEGAGAAGASGAAAVGSVSPSVPLGGPLEMGSCRGDKGEG